MVIDVTSIGKCPRVRGNRWTVERVAFPIRDLKGAPQHSETGGSVVAKSLHRRHGQQCHEWPWQTVLMCPPRSTGWQCAWESLDSGETDYEHTDLSSGDTWFWSTREREGSKADGYAHRCRVDTVDWTKNTIP